MNVFAVIGAMFGLGLTIYAAMETEAEQVGRRAGWGLLGLSIYIIGIMLI